MSPPSWRSAIANDGETRVSTLHHGDGSVSIRLSFGAISLVAAIDATLLHFLIPVETALPPSDDHQ